MKPLGMVLSTTLCVILLSACGSGDSSASLPPEVDLSVRVEPQLLAVGTAELIITLQDAQGSPIDGAVIQVHGNMDHAGMAPVERESRESLNGVYRIPFEWTMGGGWIVTIIAMLPDGGKVSRDFPFTVEAISSESIIKRSTVTAAPVNSGLNIAYSTEPAPALVGDGMVTVTLTSPDGTPITDASVNLTGDMTHAGMMPISAEGKHVGGGQYQIPLRWTMAGAWQVTITVTRPDGTQVKRTFDQEVVMP